ncbi:MAG: hypothetical protein ACPGJV_01190 [Bacteriovoracaceae bacterium]
MKKFGILLHETLIVNFPYLWKLIKRYKFVSVILPLLICSFCAHIYFKQKDFFLVKLGFQNLSSGAAASPASSLMAAFGEQTSGLKSQEVVALSRKVDFIREIATKVIEQPNFEKFRLNHLLSENLYTGEHVKEYCKNDKHCMTMKVAEVIPSYFSVIADKSVSSQFYIYIRHDHKETALKMIDLISKELVDQRVRTLRSHLKQQLKMSDDLISNKKKELENEKVFEVLDRIKQNEIELNSVTSQLDQYQKAYLTIQNRLAQASTVLNETKETLSKKVNLKKLGISKKAKQLKKKIDKLREDITSLELANSSFSTKDSDIVDRLREDLKVKEREYKKLIGSSRGVSSLDSLIEKKDRASSFSQFDVNVLKAQFKKLKKKYEELLSQKENLVDEKTKLEVRYESVKPTIEYFKLLKEKHVKLELAESTVVSDFDFDDNITEIRQYKKISHSKMILAAFSASFFLIIFTVIVIYLLDDRVFDEEELKNSFEGVEIIGNTPDFN